MLTDLLGWLSEVIVVIRKACSGLANLTLSIQKMTLSIQKMQAECPSGVGYLEEVGSSVDVCVM